MNNLLTLTVDLLDPEACEEGIRILRSIQQEDPLPGTLTGAPLDAVDTLLANTVEKLPEPPTTSPNPVVALMEGLGQVPVPPSPLGPVELPAPDPTPGVPAHAPSLSDSAATPVAAATLAPPPATSPIDFSKLGPSPSLPTLAGVASPSGENTAQAALPTSASSVISSTASPSEPPLPLGGSMLTGLGAPDFEVFLHTGEKKAGYSHSKDALQVLLGLIGDTENHVQLGGLEEANKAIRERFDRGEKSTLTRAFTRRREELAEIASMIAGGGAPATMDRPAVSVEEFRIRVQTLSSKAGIQALHAVIDAFDPTSEKKLDNIPADKYWPAIDALQQVIDSKGK